MGECDYSIPSDYDFSTKNVDFKEYEKYFNLRTDAVWEKFQIRDFFRIYSKCFLFDHDTKSYKISEPEDEFTIKYEPCFHCK